jgi:hypothetical protein
VDVLLIRVIEGRRPLVPHERGVAQHPKLWTIATKALPK